MSLVHLVPVLSSTATLTIALTEYQAHLPWLTLPSQDPHLPRHLSAWFDRWFRLGLPGILLFGITSTWGGYTASRASLGPARALYTYGACFSLAHFAFARPIARCIKRLVNGPTHPRDELALWLKIHTARMLMTDVPAFLCFLGAFSYATV